MKKLVFILFASFASFGQLAAQTSGQSVIPKKNAGNGYTNEAATIGNSQLIGRTAAGALSGITLGTGLSLSGSTLSSTGSGGTWGSITGTLSAQTDLNTALGLKANTADLGALATLNAVTSATITDGEIVNADISASAAIALSKLATDPLARANHTGTQLLSTISDAGTLAGLSAVTSALITDGEIVNADISASAAIALSKLATDPLARANHTGTQLLSTISDAGTLAGLSAVTSALITDGEIVNADINASAAIALSKLATDPLARANHTGTQAWSTITTTPTTLTGYGITDAQPLDSDLTSIAALTTTTVGRSFLAATFNGSGLVINSTYLIPAPQAGVTNGAGIGGGPSIFYLDGGDGNVGGGNGGTGGELLMSGGDGVGATPGANAGSINTSAFEDIPGGSIDTSGGGGSITTTAGGSITTGTGNINTGNTSGTLAALAFASSVAIGSEVSGLGTNVATALGVNVGSAGAVVVNGGALGTPSSGNIASTTADDTAYDATSWNGSTAPPTKNAVRDKLETMTGTGSVTSVALSGSDGIDIDSGSPITTSGTIALGINASTLKTHLSLANVENTALSTWVGTANITTLGTITTGTWTGTAIGTSYLASGATLDTEWDTLAEINAATTDADALATTAIDDTAYDASSWNGDTTHAPTKNAVRDKIESLSAGSGGNWVLVTTTTISGSPSTVDFTLTGGGRKYRLEFENVYIAGDGYPVSIRTSTDGGSTFDSGASDYDWGRGTLTNYAPTNTTSSGIELSSAVGNGTDEGMTGEVTFYDPLNTGLKASMTWLIHHLNYGTTAYNWYGGAGRRNSTGDVDAVRVFTGSTFSGGKIRLFRWSE